MIAVPATPESESQGHVDLSTGQQPRQALGLAGNNGSSISLPPASSLSLAPRPPHLARRTVEKHWCVLIWRAGRHFPKMQGLILSFSNAQSHG